MGLFACIFASAYTFEFSNNFCDRRESHQLSVFEYRICWSMHVFLAPNGFVRVYCRVSSIHFEFSNNFCDRRESHQLCVFEYRIVGPCRSMQVHACFSVFLAPNGFVSVTFASATYASSCLAYS
jgi:hypothetical protein